MSNCKVCMRSRFAECVTMLIKNECHPTKTLTYEKFLKSYDTRATIIPIGYTSDEIRIYSVVIPTPPIVLSSKSFIGLIWNNIEYVFISPLKIKQNPKMRNRVQFLHGIIKSVA